MALNRILDKHYGKVFKCRVGGGGGGCVIVYGVRVGIKWGVGGGGGGDLAKNAMVLKGLKWLL